MLERLYRNLIFLFIIHAIIAVFMLHITSQIDARRHKRIVKPIETGFLNYTKPFTIGKGSRKRKCSRPEPNSKIWKFSKRKYAYFYLFGAYWDTRRRNESAVKILTRIHQYKKTFPELDVRFRCIFWYDDRTIPVQGNLQLK